MTGQGSATPDLGRPLTFQLEVPNDPIAIGFVRRAVTFASEVCGHETAEVVGLVLTELVTNSIVHGRLGPDDRVAVSLTIGPDAVRGEVSDLGVGFSLEGDPQPGVDGGFGLFIVQRLVRRWGIDRSGPATCVWFEL